MAKAKSNGAAWSAEDDALLKRVYPTEGPDGVLKHLEGRSEIAVKSRAKYLNVRLTREALGARRTKHLAELRQAGLLVVKPKKPEADAETLPPEYIQAADIFQVGYRVAEKLGVVHEFA